MNKHAISLSTVDIAPVALTYLRDIVRSGRLTYGKFTRAFEAKFAVMHQNRFGIMVNSGTSALQIALRAAKIFHHWRDGDEVILPALTFVADINVILENGLRPVFVDVHPAYFDIDAAQIEAAIGPKTRAILVSHLFGQPAQMDAIQAIARKHKLIIIEDACHTPFARYRHKPVGSWGQMTCFSTYAAHIFTTGVGGMVITRNKQLAAILRSLSFHGRDPAYTSIEDDKNPRTLPDILPKRFLFPYRGYSYRLTEMEAALGMAQLTTYRSALRRRRQNARYLLGKLKPLEHVLQFPHVRKDATHVFMVFPIVIRDPHIRRDDLVLFLEKHGIETRYLLPLITQPAYRDLHIRRSDFPIATNLASRGFYVGCHQGLTQSDLDYVAEKLSSFIKRYEKKS